MPGVPYPLDIVTWFLPGLIVSLLVSLVLARPVATRLRESPVVVWLLLFSTGAILSATVTALAAPEGPPPGAGIGCDLSRLDLAPLDLLRSFNDTSLNILLFVPLGAALGLLRQRRTRTALTLAAIASPFAIEALQMLAPVLARSCQSADVVDNLTGLCIGWLVGWLIARTGLGRR